MRLLLLGGTTEASALAASLAQRAEIETTLSLAGRTTRPAASPVPVRVGGFGGVEGLVQYLGDQRIDAVIDATHPFAAQMSAHAVEACERARVPLAAFTRPPWTPTAGDHWTEVETAAQAVAALGEIPRRVFLTLGRLQAHAFAASAQHHFVLRSIDAPPPRDLPSSVELVLARGPFGVEAETELMTSRRIDVLVSKNSGGEATRAKIDAARALGLPVIMLRRPATAARTVVFTLSDALAWLGAHLTAS